MAAQAKDVARFIKDIERFLYSNLRNVLKSIESGEAKGIEAARILGSLETSMKELGLDKELAVVQQIYAKDLKSITSVFNAIGTKQVFTDIDRPIVEALIKGGYDQAGAYISRYLGDVREQVGLQVLSGQRVDFTKIHEAESPGLQRILETEMATTLSAFYRTVATAKGEELGFDLYEYIGPDDNVTRRFCEQTLSRVPPIYSLDEIRSLDNEQGLPVLQYGGGYNCRHIWAPISEEDARDAGWKPD